MDNKGIAHLADVMTQRHGAAAEVMARKRALRCKRMLEDDWAGTWNDVADLIARKSGKTEAAD